MEQNNRFAILNRALVRVILLVIALAAFVVSASATACMGCN